MLNSLTLQHKLIQDRMEQMQMVEKAIDNTIRQIRQYHQIDWSQMLELIHLTQCRKPDSKAVSGCLKYLRPHPAAQAFFPKIPRDGFPGFLSSVPLMKGKRFSNSAAAMEPCGMKMPTVFPDICKSSSPIFPKECCVMPAAMSPPQYPLRLQYHLRLQ